MEYFNSDDEAKEIRGKVNIKYNNYNDSFPILNGRLPAKNVDKKYCFKEVFQGKYKLKLIYNKCLTAKTEEDQKGNVTFVDLKDGQQYNVTVIEDQEAENKIEKNIYQSQDKNIEQGLRKEGCSCLFGNPCMDQYVCEDWNNRYEVAKKNSKAR